MKRTLLFIFCVMGFSPCFVFTGKDAVSVLFSEPVVPLNIAAESGIIFPEPNPGIPSPGVFLFSKDFTFVDDGVKISLTISGEFPQKIICSFFFSGDFESDGALPLSAYSENNFYIENLSGEYRNIDIVLPVELSEVKPAGVVVFGVWDKNIVPDSQFIKINSIMNARSFYGWKKSGVFQESILTYGMKKGGGTFTGIPHTLSVKDYTENNNYLINIDVSPMEDDLYLVTTASDAPKVQLSFKEINMGMTILCTVKNYHCTIPENFHQSLKGEITIDKGCEFVSGFYFSPGNKFTSETKSTNDGYILYPPISIDPGLIIKNNPGNWRNKDFEIYCWDRFPNLILIDTISYDFQDLMFKRLGAFVEKKQTAGKIPEGKDLDSLRAFNANDYNAHKLAEFFSIAEKQNIELNEQENILKNILLENQIIKKVEHSPDFFENDFSGENLYEAVSGGVISFSVESELYRRKLFFTHECFHGLFFIDEAFRKKVAEEYENADPGLISFLKVYYEAVPSLQYNDSDLYLMQNEFMAYMTQLEYDKLINHFTDYVCSQLEEVKDYEPHIDYIQNEGKLAVKTVNKNISDYLFSRWGLESGRCNLVNIWKFKPG